MAKRKSNSTSRGAVAAVALRIATLACVETPLSAQAELLISLAQTEETHGLMRISAGVGLVIFSAITIFFHLTGRQAWRRRELELRAEIEALGQQADRARSFGASDSQFVIVWGGSSNEPEIEGDIGLALDASLPRRILGFSSWLSPEQAIVVEANVSRLRERGQGFHLDLVSNNGRHLEAEGRAIGSRAVLRVRDVSGDRLELMHLRALHGEQSGAT